MTQKIIKDGGDFLTGHEITPYFRGKMIDWMLLVFKKFNKSTIETITLSVDILDRFIAIK